uniref:Alpha-carbonic anhydrase domain-containing protein n=1 Tax=Oncorhynchus kisutch TaxID=8019 RepID=A0A8C7IMH3_ONCKI
MLSFSLSSLLENSPSFWPSLPNSQCGGVRQSPINIDTNQLTFDPSLRNLTFSDITNPHSIKFLTNNGHTVSCVLEGLMEVRGGGLPHGYTAVMMHFHWGGDSLCHPGSEHTVDSVRYPMEVRYCTRRERVESFLPLVVMFLVFLILQPSPYVSGSSVDIVQPLSISDLLGSVDLTKFYRYQGSLTTPTCDEVVVWTVFEEPIKLRRDLCGLNQVTHSLYYRPRPALLLLGKMYLECVYKTTYHNHEPWPALADV